MSQKKLAVIMTVLVSVAIAVWFWPHARPSNGLDASAERVASPQRLPSTKEGLSPTIGLGSSVVRPPLDTMVQIYDAPTLAAQRTLVQTVVGDARFDAEMMHYSGDRLCNYLNGSLASTFHAAAGSSKLLPKDTASLDSYRLVDGFRSHYCGAVIDASAALEPDAVTLSLVAARDHGSRGAETLLRISAALEQSVSPSTATELQQSLTDIVRSTQSPAMLMEAGILLTTPALGEYNPPGYDSAVLSENEALLVRQFGMHLAACEVFSFCQRRNLYAVRACMPYNCRGNGTTGEYVRSILSPNEYAAARRYADAILALRR